MKSLILLCLLFAGCSSRGGAGDSDAHMQSATQPDPNACIRTLTEKRHPIHQFHEGWSCHVDLSLGNIGAVVTESVQIQQVCFFVSVHLTFIDDGNSSSFKSFEVSMSDYSQNCPGKEEAVVLALQSRAVKKIMESHSER